MKKLNKVSFVVSMVFAATFLFSENVSAHPGNTDSSGCHTCRTNCSSWGLYSGEYHCHNAKSSPQPYEPITSKYGAGGTGYTSPAPQYKAPTYTAPKPSCPSMSSYDSISDSCKCFSGYVTDTDYAGNQSCTSGTSMCQKKLGYGSKYNSISKDCECNFGYILSGGKCVSESEYCRNSLGFNAKYNSLKEACECNYGYKLENNKCVSEDDYCNNALGDNSKYNSVGDKCECDLGYTYDGNSCIHEENTISNINEKAIADPSYKDNIKSIDSVEANIVQEKSTNEIQEKPIGFRERVVSFFRKLRFW